MLFRSFHFIKGYEKLRFTLKTAHETFAEHPELCMAYYDELRDKCAVLLDNPEQANRREQAILQEIRDDIHQEYSGSDAMDMDDMFAQMINA